MHVTSNGKPENMLYMYDCPSQSPDLNIIKNMWSKLYTIVSNMFPSTIDELCKVTKKSGANLMKPVSGIYIHPFRDN